MIYFYFSTNMFDINKIEVSFSCSFYEPARKGTFTCKESDLDECITLCVKQNMNNVLSAILSQYNTSNPVRTSKDGMYYKQVSNFIKETNPEYSAQEFARAYLDTCAPQLDKLIECSQSFFYAQWVKKAKKLFMYAQFVAAGTPLITGRPGEAKAV